MLQFLEEASGAFCDWLGAEQPSGQYIQELQRDGGTERRRSKSQTATLFVGEHAASACPWCGTAAASNHVRATRIPRRGRVGWVPGIPAARPHVPTRACLEHPRWVEAGAIQ